MLALKIAFHARNSILALRLACFQGNRMNEKGHNRSGGKLISANTFAESFRVQILQDYPSTETYRLVFSKGKNAKAQTLGLFACKPWQFDVVTFVYMHARSLPIRLETERFLTKDMLAVRAILHLTAKPRPDSFSIESIATSFDEILALLTRHISTGLYAACKTVSSEELSNLEQQFPLGMVSTLNADHEKLKFPLEFLEAQLQLQCPQLEQLKEQDAIEGLQQTLKLNQLARDKVIGNIQNASSRQQLVNELEAALLRFEQEQSILLKKSANASQIDRLMFEDAKYLESLCTEARLAALRHHPETAERILRHSETAIKADGEAQLRANQQVLAQIKEIAVALRPPGGFYPPI